jgi:hypothetical protein
MGWGLRVPDWIHKYNMFWRDSQTFLAKLLIEDSLRTKSDLPNYIV